MGEFMSDFVRQVKPIRKIAVRCRAFYESYRVSQHPPGATVYTSATSGTFRASSLTGTKHFFPFDYVTLASALSLCCPRVPPPEAMMTDRRNLSHMKKHSRYMDPPIVQPWV
jgi:hypothetical protein